MPDSPDRFYRWAVAWRVVSEVEQVIATFPMVLIAPVVAAMVGTVVAVVYQPAEHVLNGVVVGPALGFSIVLAAGGSLLGGLLIAGFLAARSWGRYRFRGFRQPVNGLRGYEDPIWLPTHFSRGRTTSIDLRSKVQQPPSLDQLEALLVVHPPSSFG